MAPGNISKRARQPRAANVRAKALERVAQMEKEEGDENKKKIEEYEKLLKQKDEELEALTNEQLKDVYGLDEMDLDTNEDGNGQEVNDGEKTAEKVGDIQGEGQQEDSGNKKKSAGSDDPLPSVELKQGNSSGDNLFMPENDPSDDSDSDSATFSDPEYGRPLYSRPGLKSIKDAETVGWARPSGRTTLYINRYGKKSAAIYRLEKFAQQAEYEDNPPEDHNVSNSVKRVGDEKLENGKWKYTRRHIKGIFGVAWKVSSTGKDREDDLELINPDLVTKWTEVPSYVLIAWDLGQGQVKKCWEPRATLRSRWGKKDADIAIYEAAVTAEDRYMEGQTGKRRAISKSPSVGLAQSRVDEQRAKSLGPSRFSASRSATPKANAGFSKSRLRMASPMIDSHGEFGVDLENYLKLMGVSDFRELNRDEKQECLAVLSTVASA